MVRCFVLAVVLFGCGGDDDAPPQATAAGGVPAAGAAGVGAGSGKPLTPMVHIEDKVICPVPQVAPPAEDRCNPAIVNPCHERTKPYCLMVPAANASYCLACSERDNIRHPFRDRDFAGDPSQNRDPFQSFVLAPVGTGSADKPAIDTTTQPLCTQYNSFGGGYSYQDLKLEGIVTQGTQRKALMSPSSHQSVIVKRNDCVGKERALVKEVGDGYVTFIVLPDPAAGTANAKPVETSVSLHSSIALNGLDAPPSDQPPSRAPSNVPSPTNLRTPPTAPTTKIVPIPRAPGTKIPAPTQAPVELNP